MSQFTKSKMVVVGLLLVCLNSCNRPLETKSQSKPKTISLKQDIGVVKPSQKTKVEFVVRNTTNETWTIDRIGTTCACAVTDISKGHEVQPNTESVVQVSYTAPEVEADESRKVTLRFSDKTAPKLNLFVIAKVRNEVSVRPASVVKETFFNKPVPIEIVSIENHTGVQWTNVSAESAVD